MEEKYGPKVSMASAIIGGGLALLSLGGGLFGLTVTIVESCKQVKPTADVNKAIIFSDNCATIVDVKSWRYYGKEQYQIITEDDVILIVLKSETRLINDTNSDIKAEDIARSILGEDAEINYLNNNKKLTLKNGN